MRKDFIHQSTQLRCSFDFIMLSTTAGKSFYRVVIWPRPYRLHFLAFFPLARPTRPQTQFARACISRGGGMKNNTHLSRSGHNPRENKYIHLSRSHNRGRNGEQIFVNKMRQVALSAPKISTDFRYSTTTLCLPTLHG